MPSVLAPVCEKVVKEDTSDWYGAIELDTTTGEPVWSFDGTSSFEVSRFY